MKVTTTNGKEHCIIENCPYCSPNTVGQHSINCPNYRPPVMAVSPSESWLPCPNDFELGVKAFHGIGFFKNGESYADYVVRRKREVDEHPKEGITYIGNR